MTTKKIINGNEIKITNSGYIYKNNKKISNTRVTPINYPIETINFSKEEFDIIDSHLKKTWKLM